MERVVSFEACFNFRDLGGYETVDGRRLRWGRLFRSDALHRFTAADLDAFAALGLRTVIDLRGPAEIDDHGRLTPALESVTWHNFSLLDGIVLRPDAPQPEPEPSPGAGYVDMVRSEPVAGVFRTLTHPDALPAVFHCTMGKDRTGVIAALLLDVLGVPDDTIAEDYALTEASFERAMAYIAEHEPDFAAFIGEHDPGLLAPTPDKILGFLAGVRARHGSAAQLLAELGIPDAALLHLRATLLE